MQSRSRGDDLSSGVTAEATYAEFTRADHRPWYPHTPTKGRVMRTEPEHSDIGTGPQAESEQPSGPAMNGESERRADIEEDRRRLRELDEGELGGEA